MDEQTLSNFLNTAGWENAHQAPLAGDASARRYLRLTDGPNGASAILMIAPPAPDDSTSRFVALARHLRDHDISTPQVLAAEPEQGLALLEDLGDALMARLITEDPSREAELYHSSVNQLIKLAQVPVTSDMPLQSVDSLVLQIDPVVQWYVGQSRDTKDPEGDALARTELNAALRPLLKTLFQDAAKPVFVHRDYHAENLIWCADRSDPMALAMIDFQDAMSGAIGYDLVSLLEDARRDLTPELRGPLIEQYAQALDLDETKLERDLCILGAQRNLRILGIFARLCLHLNKPHYVDLMPRVWAHLSHDLSHPDLTELLRAVEAHLPPPSPELLESLKSKCGTILTP